MSADPPAPTSDDAPAVIRHCAFDLGGVLFADGTRALRQHLAAQGFDGVVDAVLRSPESRALRAGLMDDDTFWRWAADRLPDGLDATGLRTAWYDSYTLDRDVMQLLCELHGAGVSLVAFSGNIRSRVEHLDRRHQFRRLFRVEVWSYEHGVTKPDPRFVEALLRTLGCRPDQIAYVDDKDSALAPARARGIVGIRYRSGEIGPLRDALFALGLPATRTSSEA